MSKTIAFSSVQLSLMLLASFIFGLILSTSIFNPFLIDESTHYQLILEPISDDQVNRAVYIPQTT